MIDIQHDSPTPIHEQITSQLRAHIASGAITPGTRLAEYRKLAQELLTNPQAVARAYDDLELDGILRKAAAGCMEVTPKAAMLCRAREQELARGRLQQAVVQSLAVGMNEAEVLRTVTDELAAARVAPRTSDNLATAIQEAPHVSRHRDSSALQDLSRQGRAGSAEPPRAGGGHLRPAGG